MDDAILSAYSLFTTRPTSTVVTVFDGHPAEPVSTEWDALCGFRDSTTAMTRRHREDEAAFAGLPVRRDYLGLLDSSYLGAPRRDDASALEAYVRDWVGLAPGPALVAIPAGAGRRAEPPAPPTPARRRRRALVRAAGPMGRGILRARARRASRRAISVTHEDHQYVRDHVLALRSTLPDVTIALYEELPYVWGQPADHAVAAAASAYGFSPREQSLPVDRERKASAIRAYRSQLRALPAPHGRLDVAQTLPERERFWLVPPPEAEPPQAGSPQAGSLAGEVRPPGPARSRS